ncbi:unnamed protein product [marine sediment metagenome]|uniref:Uncharacterized protein n=1 Tax=marine sediment metagenome TaxID=412755 RepID=X1HJN9_9ZZZZ
METEREILERYTCVTCRDPIGHKDLASIKEQADRVLIETYHCTPCAIKLLKETSYEEAVEKQAVLKWIGKTWSFEMSLYKKDVWDDFQRGLEDGNLFPEDVLNEEESKEAGA